MLAVSVMGGVVTEVLMLLDEFDTVPFCSAVVVTVVMLVVSPAMAASAAVVVGAMAMAVMAAVIACVVGVDDVDVIRVAVVVDSFTEAVYTTKM